MTGRGERGMDGGEMGERLTAGDFRRSFSEIDQRVYEVKYQGERARAFRTLALDAIDHIAAIEAERDRLQAMVNRVIEGRGYVADDDEFIAMLDAHDAATRAEEGRGDAE